MDSPKVDGSRKKMNNQKSQNRRFKRLNGYEEKMKLPFWLKITVFMG